MLLGDLAIEKEMLGGEGEEEKEEEDQLRKNDISNPFCDASKSAFESQFFFWAVTFFDEKQHVVWTHSFPLHDVFC